MVVEKLKCDICLNEFDADTLYHFSGILDSKLNKHIHVCEECVKRFKIKMIDFDKLINKNLKTKYDIIGNGVLRVNSDSLLNSRKFNKLLNENKQSKKKEE